MPAVCLASVSIQSQAFGVFQSQALDWWCVATLPLNTYNHGMRIQQDSRGGGTWGRMEGRRRMTVSSFAYIRFCFSLILTTHLAHCYHHHHLRRSLFTNKHHWPFTYIRRILSPPPVARKYCPSQMIARAEEQRHRRSLRRQRRTSNSATLLHTIRSEYNLRINDVCVVWRGQYIQGRSIRTKTDFQTILAALTTGVELDLNV